MLSATLCNSTTTRSSSIAQDGSWVAEIPAISACYALMPTREAALAELSAVFDLIAGEYRDKGFTTPFERLTNN
jgi:predicted RNase H-like HicB family nuclease